MFKALVRYLFMKFYHDELIQVARYVRREPPKEGICPRLIHFSEVCGALEALEILDLLV